jgi:multiple sugar transport system substrate-binding protein
MFLKKNLVGIFAATLLTGLLIASFKLASSVDASELSILMEPDGTGVFRDLINSFNSQHPGHHVRLVEGPPSTDTREEMYSTAFLAGSNGYDIVYCDVIWVPKFAAAGWLLDLTERLSPQDRKDLLTADAKASTYQGRLYRIPAFTDAGLLYYRTDLVPDPPRTFEQLMDLSSRLKTKDRWGFLWQGKQYEGLVTDYLEILWGYGGEWITEDRRVLLDHPEAVEALRFLTNTVGTVSPPGVTTYAEEETRNLFQSGQAVFLRNWFYVRNLIESSQNPVRGHVGIVPMVHAPGKSSAATLGGWGFGISRRSPYPDVAWQFIEFVTAPEQLRLVYQRAGRIPARNSTLPTEFREILDHARMRPGIPEYAQASDILQRWLSAALTGRSSPEDALRNAARETRLLLGGEQ